VPRDPPAHGAQVAIGTYGMEERMASESAREAADAQIRALVDGWAEALRARNVEGVMAHHAPDSLTFDLAPPLISTGADAKGLQAWFATWQGPLGYEIRDLNVTAGDEAAFCHGLVRLSGTKTSGEKADVWFRLTLCFRRIGGAWRIVHQHESVPFYMDGSYRAAVDLTP
jgi:ketosteroid isomerase-like protein